MSLPMILAVIFAQMAALSLIMAGAWAVQQRTRNSGFIDAVWTFGLGGVGIVSALLPLNGGTSTRQLVVAVIILAWSLRLGLHILRRTLDRADDPRYAALTRQWGTHARRQMFILLQKQALVTLPLAIAIFVAAHNPAPFGRFQDWLGVFVILLGVLGEALSDQQLKAWLKSRQEDDRICQRGLWAWSRHPNYFFEWVFWLAFPLFAISLAEYPCGWLALGAPVCMYWLLVHVSGVPPLEQHMLAKHGDAYRAYQARTSVFFPRPPAGGSA